MGGSSRRRACVLVAVVSSLIGLTAPALGQESTNEADRLFDGRAKDLVKTIALNAFRRFRRGNSLGPMVGVAPGTALDPSDADVRLSFGLSLYHFDIPLVPGASELVEILKSRAKERFLAEAARFASGGPPTPEAARILAEQVWEDIKREFLEEHRPRKLERPGFGILAEVSHLPGADAWELSALFSIGISRVYVSAGPVGHFADGADLYTAFELGVPVLVSDSLRSPVLHLSLRADIATTSRDERADRLFVAARFSLDIL